jgi:dethiobiotin synthetase
MGRIVFITGTDTGVGKTVAAGLLLYHLRRSGVRALAMKPFCSGGRGDVEVLQGLQEGELEDEVVNPWCYKGAVAPLVAARWEGKRVHLKEVLQKITLVSSMCEVLLVEGAGGVLSPLGEGVTFDKVIGELGGSVVVVGPNRLGVVNHVLLTLKMLGSVKKKAVVLMGQRGKGDPSVSSNRDLLVEWGGGEKKGEKKEFAYVFEVPFLGCKSLGDRDLKKVYKNVKKVLQELTVSII